MWGIVLDWLLLLVAPYLVHCEPLSLKPLCQPFKMAEMPPLFSAPHDENLPHNPRGNVPPKKFMPLTMVTRSRHYGYSGSLQ